jgi:hypothetical protein
MALDPVVNFFQSEIATLPVSDAGVTIVLSSGDGAKLPNPAVDGAFNLTIYKDGDPFASPEIVRVTARSTDTLTVTRAQEGSIATTKTAGSTWKVVMFPTAKTIQDIDSLKVNKAGDTMTGTLSATKLVPTGNVTAGNGMYLPATNQIAIGTNGSERVRIDASGNVGVGVTPSAWSGEFGSVLQFKSAGSNGGGSLTGSSGTNFRMFSNAFYNGNYKYIINGPAAQYEQDSYHAWSNAPSGTAGNAITFTERMRIDASGNVGIGTTSPAARLDVNGTLNVGSLGSGSDAIITLSNNASIGTRNIYYKASNATINITSTGGGDLMTISNGGNVGIGTTSPTNPLTVNGIVSASTDNARTLGTASLRWSEVFAGNGTINTSDATEKQDIKDLNEAEQQVAVSLKGLIKKYRWISSVEAKGDDARIHIGVMAQDVQQAFEDAGLDAENYGVFCKDVWHTKEEEYTEKIDNPDFNQEEEESEDNPKQIDSEPKTRPVECEPCEESTEHIRYGVRYDQLFAFIISAL